MKLTLVFFNEGSSSTKLVHISINKHATSFYDDELDAIVTQVKDRNSGLQGYWFVCALSGHVNQFTPMVNFKL